MLGLESTPRSTCLRQAITDGEEVIIREYMSNMENTNFIHAWNSLLEFYGITIAIHTSIKAYSRKWTYHAMDGRLVINCNKAQEWRHYILR